MTLRSRNQALDGRARVLAWVLVPGLLALLLATGCGSADGGAVELSGGGSGGNGDVSGAGGNGGSMSPAQNDGVEGLASNPVDQLLADPQRNPGMFLGTDALGPQGYGDAARACYGEPDACDAFECGAFASCCVDTARCCKPLPAEPPLPSELDFGKCAGLTLDQCAQPAGASITVFGPREPLLTSRGLVPNGTATSEGGALVGEAVDLSTQRVGVDVQFTLPLGCNGTCLESAGVAFTAAAPDAFVDAEVGLLLSGSREAVQLLIGGEVADSFPLGTGGSIWSLVLLPSGSAEVRRDGALQGVYPFDSASLSNARLALFGRNLNVAETSAAISRITLDIEFCDNPRAWTAREPIEVQILGEPIASVRAPSIAQSETTTLVAFELDAEIYVGEPQQGQLVIQTGPALMPSEPDEAQGVGDPELLWDGNVWLLFYTARDESGAGRIRVAVASQSSFVRSELPVLAPSGNVASFEAPSVVLRNGLWIMVVKATRTDGTTELQAYYTSDLQNGWARIVDGGLEPLTRISDPTSEITSPSLIIHNSAYQLYYARRSGTRWSVGLAVSDELLLWRDLGVTLGPSGEGFDSLGARGPDALSAFDRIDLVYTGQNGISFQLGSASRPAPTGTAPNVF